MRNALKDLGLRELSVVHGGERTFPLGAKIKAVAFARLLDDLEVLRA